METNICSHRKADVLGCFVQDSNLQQKKTLMNRVIRFPTFLKHFATALLNEAFRSTL